MSNLLKLQPKDNWEEKARWAASVFAKLKYRGFKTWYVEIKSIEMFASEDASNFEIDIMAHAWQAETTQNQGFQLLTLNLH